MRKHRVVALGIGLCLAFASAGASAAVSDVEHEHGTMGIDLGFLLAPSAFQTFDGVPGSDQLTEIVHVGSRVLEWADTLQANVPVAEREQLWRRIDRIGHEASPEHPNVYNPARIRERYDTAMAQLDGRVAQVLRAESALPAAPPQGIAVKDLVASLRPLLPIYTLTSRWLELYGWKDSLVKSRRDLRAWIFLNNKLEEGRSKLGRWADLGVADRQALVEAVAAACPIALGSSIDTCLSQYRSAVNDPRAGGRVLSWYERVIARGREIYDAKFGVQHAHPGVGKEVNAGFHKIELSMIDIPREIFQWIDGRLREAWTFGDRVGVVARQVPSSVYGVVRVRWQKGALPNVNGIGGDVITMDANTPRWLEHTQTVMRHELGHVLGFPDCYTEFWDEDLDSFVYYTLDPTDAMCALSGEFKERHELALKAGYFRAK